MNWSDKNNQVALNCIWREHIKKEISFTKLSENFRLNPKTMVLITEKPQIDQNANLEKQLEGQQLDPETSAMLNRTLEDAVRVPKEKYKHPMTSAQEIGWTSKPLVPHNPLFHHARQSSEPTSYAEAYVTSLKVSPFSKGAGKT